MIAFEQTAKDPKRLFRSSFQLNEEEKFRRRAYPTLLKLETILTEAIEKFENGRLSRTHLGLAPCSDQTQRFLKSFLRFCSYRERRKLHV